MIKYMGLVFLLSFGLIADDEKAPTEDLKAKLTPENLDFTGLDAEMGKYIKSFSEEEQKTESRRVGIVKNFKKMVQKVVSRTPYEGRISLKKTAFLGKITEAKDDSLTIVDNKGAISSVNWEDINPRMYSDIFISEAVNKGKELSAGKRIKGADEAFKKAGNYYFALAVFYDWYGNKPAAVLFRNKALILNPDKKEEINKLWPAKENLKN